MNRICDTFHVLAKLFESSINVGGGFHPSAPSILSNEAREVRLASFLARYLSVANCAVSH